MEERMDKLVIIGKPDDVWAFIRKVDASYSHLDLRALIPAPKAGEDFYGDEWQQKAWGNEELSDVSRSTVLENGDNTTVTYRFKPLRGNFNYPKVPTLSWLSAISRQFPDLQTVLSAHIGKQILTITSSKGSTTSYWSEA